MSGQIETQNEVNDAELPVACSIFISPANIIL